MTPTLALIVWGAAWIVGYILGRARMAAWIVGYAREAMKHRRGGDLLDPTYAQVVHHVRKAREARDQADFHHEFYHLNKATQALNEAWIRADSASVTKWKEQNR